MNSRPIYTLLMTVLVMVTLIQIDYFITRGRITWAAAAAANLAIAAVWFGMNFGLIPIPAILNKCWMLCK